MNKQIVIFGGGTFDYVANHLALAAPAFGETARKLAELSRDIMPNLDVNLKLTKMADHTSKILTNDDVEKEVQKCIESNLTKIIIMNAALCDFNGVVSEPLKKMSGIVTYSPVKERGKHAKRLQSALIDNEPYRMDLYPNDKIISKIRKVRKDIFLVGFKTTTGNSEDEQYIAGLNLLKKNSCNLVLANDVVTRTNMVITPEEARYHVTTDRDEALKGLLEMAFYRSHLSFTRSTVVEGTPVPWDSPEVPESLRTVVNYCINNKAYKPFNGATVGHFACKLSDQEFLTSIRKTNFNDLSKNGLVRVKTDGPDTVLAFGAKPSVGGQSQRIVFNDHEGYDCIVHFHSPLKEGSEIPVVSQRLVECGSHACGRNTSNNLKQFGNLKVVYLDNHGPNIIFNKNIDPQEVIDFINANFDLSQKTGGFVSVEDLPINES
jgi:hypothetical protein